MNTKDSRKRSGDTSEIWDEIESDLNAYKHAEKSLLAERDYLRSARERLRIATDSQSIVLLVSQAIQTQAHKQITRVVTRCLKAIFVNEGYNFRIEFLRKRGRTEARMHFLQHGHEVSPKQVGGSVLDVAAYGLRIACVLLSTPRRRKYLQLDEPFRMVDVKHADRVRELVETVAKEMRLQHVLTTHNPKLASGKIVQL